MSAPNARLCDEGLQSGCHNLTPCHAVVARRSISVRLTRCCSSVTSRNTRRAMSSRVKRWTSACVLSSVQSNQLVSSSWQ